MKVLLAFDKFKHSLTADEACAIAAEAICDLRSDCSIDIAPLTDGGDGFCHILTSSLGGREIPISVFDPLFRPVDAVIGIVDVTALEAGLREDLGLPARGKIAIVEMAAASGLDRLVEKERDLWRTSSFGTGELLAHAAVEGVAAIILGVGGSATNDLGLGALEALGLRFIGCEMNPVNRITPSDFKRVSSLAGKIRQDLPPILIACDVANPLLGPNGASAVFGPQKGLLAEDFARLDRQMEEMAGRLCQYCKAPAGLISEAGSGAAGGISFGLKAALGARICPGFDLVSRWLKLSEKVARADIILTGEGRFDASSLQGKGPGALPVMAAETGGGKKVKVFAGSLGEGLEHLLPEGMDIRDLTAISDPRKPIEESLAKCGSHLYKAVQAYFSCLE